MSCSVYLGLSILVISKILMYEFWYDYVKTKYNEKAKLCHMGTDSFIDHVKMEDIAKDVEKRVGTSNYNLERLPTQGKSKKSYGLNER